MHPEQLKIAGGAWHAGGQEKEWLLTNGLGGYASGTLNGDLTRRYHGLFLPNLANPKGRHLMISRYCEEIQTGDLIANLGGCIDGEGNLRNEDDEWLEHFTLEGNVARWTYRIDKTVLERSIFLPHTQNTVCVRYRLLSGNRVDLKLRPFLAFRRQDAPLQESGYGRFEVTLIEGRLDITLPGSDLLLRTAVRPAPAVFVADTLEIAQELDRERKRGNEFRESAYSPGYFMAELTGEKPLSLVATTHNPERMHFDCEAAYSGELQRVATLRDSSLEGDRVATLLSQAADQFLVVPASRIEDAIIANAAGQEFRTVIAGYHWFGDWGRDTMIALEGLMLCTRRFREARATLQTFAGYVAEGLLPNLFPEGERQGLYHTVDATLWYFHALNRYVRTTGDEDLLAELMPTLEGILDWHFRGTQFGIHVDQDGLLSAGAEGYQLTWMDAKVDGWVVTPRRGKPVEIQALWYNALQLMQEWTRAADKKQAWRRAAERAKASFDKRFWNPSRGCLMDVIDGPNGNDASIRPNQMFAISLDYPILDSARWDTVMSVITAELLTPYGLRTLSRDHADYRSTYHGDLRVRDGAYHQGTVWPWLLGHYVDALLKIYKDKRSARKLLAEFEDHLLVAGIGGISEIFDAEPPHLPHGCIAQAWSVAEVLRAWIATRPDAI